MARKAAVPSRENTSKLSSCLPSRLGLLHVVGTRTKGDKATKWSMLLASQGKHPLPNIGQQQRAHSNCSDTLIHFQLSIFSQTQATNTLSVPMSIALCWLRPSAKIFLSGALFGNTKSQFSESAFEHLFSECKWQQPEYHCKPAVLLPLVWDMLAARSCCASDGSWEVVCLHLNQEEWGKTDLFTNSWSKTPLSFPLQADRTDKAAVPERVHHRQPTLHRDQDL